MPKKKRGPIFIVFGVILITALILGAYIYRTNQKKHFDKLYNANNILKVEYGIIPQKDLFMEKNALFKRVNQDNYYYLHITEDNILFTYYLDWYYTFDPLKGYNLVYEMKISDEAVENIMKSIKEKDRDSLYATIESEYITLHYDNKTSYIKTYELQAILQENDLILDI
ncbi:MAG: hypothetical protein IJO63_04285 [Bacilli bacterium]|nr:hypothetical protein [Bacilli bacterium]